MATLNKYRKNYISNMINALHRRWIVLRLSTGRLAGIGKTSQAVHNLLGFLAAALVYWGLTAKGLPQAPAMGVGLLACYTLGTIWFYLLYGGSVGSILTLCVFPYIIPDLLKLSLALVVTRRVSRAIPR